MTTQADHELTVNTTHNEDSLQTYISTLRMFILNEIGRDSIRSDCVRQYCEFF